MLDAGRRWILFWIGLLVAGLLLAITGRVTDPAAELEVLAGLSPRAWAWVALAWALELPHLAVRALRWRLLFGGPRPRFGAILSATLIGYLYNNLIARSGEVVRVLLVQRAVPRLGPAGTAVTIATDRLVDVSMVLAITALLLVASPFEAAHLVVSPALAMRVAAIGLAAVLGVALAVRAVDLLERVARAVAGRLPARPRELLERLADGACTALRELGSLDARAWGALVLVSLAEYAVVITMFRIIALAFGIDLPWHHAAFVVAASGFGAMVPSGPGNVGSMVLAMTLAARATAAAPVAGSYALLCFGAYYVVRTVLGLGALGVELRGRLARPGRALPVPG